MSSSDVESVMMTHGADGSPAIELYFGLVSWGYAWCFPKKNGFNIGIGCRLDKQENLQQKWDDFVAKIEREKGIELDVSNRISYRVPLGDKLNRCIARRSMLVGDAAGLVSSFTGEGISYAIQSGVLAAKIAREAVESKSPLHVVEYDKQLKATIGQELMDTRWLTEILNKSHKHMELLFQIVADDPVIRRYMTDIVTRVTTLSDVKVQLGKRLLSKHPLKALRLGLR